MARTVELLPAPFEPITPTNSPSPTVSETCRTASMRP